jgi:RNA polymerase-binding transcription factor DksA
MRREDNPQSGPRWRVILEERWQDRLREVTELSVAYHGAAAQLADGTEDRRARQLLRQAVAARRRLADTEEALGRLAAGRFGQCEQCTALITQGLLVAVPESRYCADCADCAAPAGVTITGVTAAARASLMPAPRRAAAGRW